MVELNRDNQNLDRVFAALADSSRRKMLERLRQRPLTISELAQPFSMSFAGVAKHIEVLTTAGLVRKVRAADDGRSYRLELQNSTLNAASKWLEYHRKFWLNKLGNLEAFIEEENHENRSSEDRKKH